MTETSKPKTLTLKQRPSSNRPKESPARQRSGARARAVAQRQTSPEPHSTAAGEHSNPKQRATGPGTNRKTHTKSSPPKTAGHKTKSQEPAARGPSRTPGKTATAPQRQQQKTPASLFETDNFPLFISCPKGIEEALTAELQALGFADARADRSGCLLHTSWSGMMRINLYSRLATRVLLQVSRGTVQTEDDIYNLARRIPWERWFGAEQTLRVDTSAIRSPFHSLQYCNLLTKDAICDHLRDLEGARPNIDTVRPDARVHLFLDESSARLYLDTSGESLFKRGWRFDKGEAPIRENLAAGMLALSGWNPHSQTLLDPFCGSGTLLIEAAWIARGIPPGLHRPFAFQRLRNYDADAWETLKEEALASISSAPLAGRLFGSDLDPAAINAARSNLARAGLQPDDIQFSEADACTLPAPAGSGHIVTNPPYGERLLQTDDAFWAAFSGNLKQQFGGWQVHIISSDFELPQKMRLKPRRRHPLFNGPLDCRLFSFDIVDGGYRQPA